MFSGAAKRPETWREANNQDGCTVTRAKPSTGQLRCASRSEQEPHRHLDTSWSAHGVSSEAKPINGKAFSPLAKLLTSSSTQQEKWDLLRDLTGINSFMELCQKFCHVSGRSCELQTHSASVRLMKNYISAHDFLLFLLALEKPLSIMWATPFLGCFPPAWAL